PLVEAKLPAVVKKAVVQKLQGQLIKNVTLEGEGLTNKGEVTTEVEEMFINVISVTNGDTGLLNVQNVIKKDKE
ncbi:hypothetical protein, partial [Actinobacillus pleuropneumoniae]